MNTAIHTVPVAGIAPVEVTVADYGSGQPFLLLHGGAGPQSVAEFAEAFASAYDVRVLVPIHPGFGATPRPEALNSVAGSRRSTTRCWTSSTFRTSPSSGIPSEAGSPRRSPC
jgi:pimeloyl-ACP methyl ester carboxylesterase